MRYPRLEMLRAQRKRVEDEIAQPHKLRADLAVARAREAQEALAGLERVMRSKMAPVMVEQISREMGHGFYSEIMKALASLGGATATTTITVPTGMLLSADRDSVVSGVVDWWKLETMPRMSLRAFKGEAEIRQGVTVLDVRVPELRYRHAIYDLS